MKKFLKYVYLSFGSFITALGINAFLVPKNIAAGGVSGIATIIYLKTGFSLGATYLIFNAFLFVFGYKYLSKKSLWYTLYATLNLSLFLQVGEGLVFHTDDIIICSIYGGVFVGVGLGIVIISGGATGGVDLFALMVNKVKPNYSIPFIITVTDILIVIASAIAFGDYSLILYAVMSIFISNKIVDYIINGVNFAKSVMVITDKYDKISECIMKKMQRGVTGIYAKGMFFNDEKMALLCVVRPKEIYKLKKIVFEYDKNAFMIMSDVRETLGKGFERRL